MTCHWQNQTGGYAFRYAHPDEAAQQPAGWAADPRGVPEVARDGNRILWLAGPLPDTDRERLASVRRPARYDKSAASKLWGVVATPGRPGRWTAYYVYDPARRSRWRAVGRDFPDAVTAAVAREAFLDGHPEFAAINRRNDVASPI